MNARAERIHALLWGEPRPASRASHGRIWRPIQPVPDLAERARSLSHDIVPNSTPGAPTSDPESMRWGRFLAVLNLRPGSGYHVVAGPELRRWYLTYASLDLPTDHTGRFTRADVARLTYPAASCPHGWVVIQDGHSCATPDPAEVATLTLAHPGVTRIVPIPEDDQ